MITELKGSQWRRELEAGCILKDIFNYDLCAIAEQGCSVMHGVSGASVQVILNVCLVMLINSNLTVCTSLLLLKEDHAQSELKKVNSFINLLSLEL